MSRLTEKVKNTDDYIRLATKDKQEFINKLGRLEDMEEELEFLGREITLDDMIHNLIERLVNEVPTRIAGNTAKFTGTEPIVQIYELEHYTVRLFATNQGETKVEIAVKPKKE